MKRRFIYFLLFAVMTLFAALPALAVTIQEEIDLGKKVNESVLKENKLYSDNAAQKEFREMGESLVKYVKRREIPYTFQILDSNDLNAFAVPGGFVYFTSRLWNTMNKDERQGVLAHEITHCDQRHSIDAMLKHQRRRSITGIILILTGANDTLIQASDVVNTLHELKYSRGDERQADEMGTELLAKAGMNPAGVLLSMRKIMRFQAKNGGEQPKIFSSHPPTKERLEYLQQLLTKMGIPIPGENIGNVRDTYQIGTLVSVKNDIATFTTTRTLKKGDIIWLTRSDWDSKYENMTYTPYARGVVDTVGATYTAKAVTLDGSKKLPKQSDVKISFPDIPEPENILGHLNGSTITSTTGFRAGERLGAWQIVWNKALGKFVWGTIGYVVVRDSSGNTKPVMIQREEYSYAPMSQNAILKEVADPLAHNWVAAIASIGNADEVIEAIPGDMIKDNTTYLIRTPIWEKERKIVAKAKLKSRDGKTILSVDNFEKDLSFDDIKPGFDIYKE